jgi:hypothetical protein
MQYVVVHWCSSFGNYSVLLNIIFFSFFKGNHQSDSFERSYRVGNILGKGGFGTVYSGVRVCDGVLVSSEP